MSEAAGSSTADLISQDAEESDPVGPEEKMDRDFLFFLTYIPVTYQNLRDEDRALCKEWLKRLTSKRPFSISGKRTRNMYLVNLVLQMGDGKLGEPFGSRPPLDKLKPPRKYFGGFQTDMVCSENLNFDIEDYSEFSRDGRTYFATRELAGGRGAIAYVGVSTGGGDTVWIDIAGNPVCPNKLEQSRRSSSDGNKEGNIIENILKERSPCPDRSGLTAFYADLLTQVNEIIKNYGTDCEPYYPVIEKMLEDLQVEAIEVGKIDCEIQGYTRLQWLEDLQKNLQYQQNTAAIREKELNLIEKEVSQKEEGILFLDLSDSVKPEKPDTIFEEAARDRPSRHNLEDLKKNYPDCIVQKLLMLLEKEKLNVIMQERNIYQDFIVQLKTEIMNTVAQGLKKYSVAKKEWHRVVTVMRHVNQKLLRELELKNMGKDPSMIEKMILTEEELAKAIRKLEDSQKRSDEIEARLTALHDQVHKLAYEYENMAREGNSIKEQLEQERCLLKRELQNQERKINSLQVNLMERQSCNKH